MGRVREILVGEERQPEVQAQLSEQRADGADLGADSSKLAAIAGFLAMHDLLALIGLALRYGQTSC